MGRRTTFSITHRILSFLAKKVEKRYWEYEKEKFTELEFIMCNHKLQDWEQMLQMSLCKHNIIANSTITQPGVVNNRISTASGIS